MSLDYLMLSHSPSKPISLSLPRFLIFLTGILFLLGWAGWVGFQNAGVWLSKSDLPKKVEVIICLGGPERILPTSAKSTIG